MLPNNLLPSSALSNAALLDTAFLNTPWSNNTRTGGFLADIGHIIQNASPVAILGAVCAGLAIASAARVCLSRIQVPQDGVAGSGNVVTGSFLDSSGKGDVPETITSLPHDSDDMWGQVVLASMSEPADRDQLVQRTAVPSLPPTPTPSVIDSDCASGGATPAESPRGIVSVGVPSKLVSQLSAKLSSLSSHSISQQLPNEGGEHSLVSLDADERTRAAIALKSQGANASRLATVNKPRVARNAKLEQNQKIGIEGRQASLAIKRRLDESRQAELAARQARVAAARGRRA